MAQRKNAAKPRDRSDIKDQVLSWIDRRAESHLIFKLWRQFLLRDFPAYIVFRTAVRGGDFKLRMDTFGRLASLFCITGKDRYQSLAAHHLFDLTAIPDSDMEVLSELFSVRNRGGPFSRVGLDEQ